ncbi:TPA: LytR/AlgR family response regulator transcription factor [Clostridium sporogenes]
MLNIIICENNNVQRKKIENIIIEELNKFKLNDIRINLSTTYHKDVIKHIKLNGNKNYIYFFNVRLNSSIDGIKLASIIRKYDSKGYIVFVSSYPEAALLTFKYKVQAIDYILFHQDNLKIRISECLNIAYNNFRNLHLREKKYISIDIGNKIINLNYNDILFFETYKDHKIKLHTFNTQIDFYSSLKKIKALVPSYFHEIHQSYIVNIKHIKSIDKNNFIVSMDNNEVCYISRRYLKILLKSVLSDL